MADWKTSQLQARDTGLSTWSSSCMGNVVKIINKLQHARIGIVFAAFSMWLIIHAGSASRICQWQGSTLEIAMQTWHITPPNMWQVWMKVIQHSKILLWRFVYRNTKNSVRHGGGDANKINWNVTVPMDKGSTWEGNDEQKRGIAPTSLNRYFATAHYRVVALYSR